MMMARRTRRRTKMAARAETAETASLGRQAHNMFTLSPSNVSSAQF